MLVGGGGREGMDETQGRGFNSQPVSFVLALTHPETWAGRAGSLDSEQMQVRAHSLEARSALDDDRWIWCVAAKGGPCPPPLPFCLAGAQREDGGWGPEPGLPSPGGLSLALEPNGARQHTQVNKDTLIKQ